MSEVAEVAIQGAGITNDTSIVVLNDGPESYQRHVDRILVNMSPAEVERLGEWAKEMAMRASTYDKQTAWRNRYEMFNEAFGVWEKVREEEAAA